MSSVLKPWVSTLPFRMQSVLMAALRGCDTARKDDASKFITRGLRSVCMHNADPTNTYMLGEIPDTTYVEAFLGDLDSYPLHFVAHTMHAAEIVGHKHHEKVLRAWWLAFYFDLVKGLHLNPETEAQLNVRLGATPAEEKVKREQLDHVADILEDKVVKWDAGTGTSHGKSDYG